MPDVGTQTGPGRRSAGPPEDSTNRRSSRYGYSGIFPRSTPDMRRSHDETVASHCRGARKGPWTISPQISGRPYRHLRRASSSPLLLGSMSGFSIYLALSWDHFLRGTSRAVPVLCFPRWIKQAWIRWQV